MSKIAFPRMAVLQTLDSLLADITPYRFVTTRPNAVGDPMREFALLRISQPIRDRGDTYQSTTGQIVIFVRDVNGMENVCELERLQNAVLGLFPIVTEMFHARRPALFPGGTDDAGFHYIIIQFNITILK